MKVRKQPATPKQPPQTAEEELPDVLSNPALRPTITFPGITDCETSLDGTETAPPPDPERHQDGSGATSLNEGASLLYLGRDAGTEGAAGAENNRAGVITAPVSIPDLKHAYVPTAFLPKSLPGYIAEPRYSKPKPRFAPTAEAGHSHGEQFLYAALWQHGKTFDADVRAITIGFGTMAHLVRLSLNNCRLNTRSLIRKLSIEEFRSEVCDQKIGKTYLVYSPEAIARRRKEAGLQWIIRTKGVVFVDPNTGAPLSRAEDLTGIR